MLMKHLAGVINERFVQENRPSRRHHINETILCHCRLLKLGKVFALIRLGLGLNSAPKIMSNILKTVLAKKPEVSQGMSSYIDDIIVDVRKVKATDVVHHLGRYGLVTKPPEKLEGVAVLGLKLRRGQDGELMFTRANNIPTCDQLTE
ncbi:hypothetical protein ElyMa_005477300 [Elysia marginata]|uniref:Reverse transcriptase domain-containing protein n=1 Tax=Elysia marginata TaxID=1093978 RepID=A0AAV4EQX0_9GAST|nr:hypothetical protein ElyMa_005477300 [Elysia marginata]